MGGIKVGGRKVFSLAYADDVVVVAEEEGGMRRMMRRLEKYVGEKGLEVNVEKTKMMRCRRGGGRWKKITWKWKGKEIEEVRKFKYLGYTMMANGGQKEHLREVKRKGAVVMREVWGIGKRRFGKDWARRLWLFDRLVWAVMGYGAEIWGWKEREELERIQDRFLKWVTGVERSTPGYMVREELQRDKLMGRAGMRAWGYERKLDEGKGGELARWCWEELRERAKRGLVVGEWEKERGEYYEGKGWSVKEVEELREEGRPRGEELITKERRRQEKERWERIRESRFNKWYGGVKGKGVPEYLKKGWKEERWQRVIKFRLGNGMGGNKYWEKEERRKCRMCGLGEETWEHVWEECTSWGNEKGWQEAVEVILGEEGEGEEWMKKLEEMREGRREIEIEIKESENEEEIERMENTAETEVQRNESVEDE